MKGVSEPPIVGMRAWMVGWCRERRRELEGLGGCERMHGGTRYGYGCGVERDR